MLWVTYLIINIISNFEVKSKKFIFQSQPLQSFSISQKKMSSLSQAGQSIVAKQINRAFTKGLYGVDPAQLQRKQIQRKMYQQELRQQAQQVQRRKAAEKQRDRQEDQKLQRKIQLDMIRQKEEKAALERATKTQKQGNTINNTNTNTTALTNSRTNEQTNQRRNYNNTSAQNTMSKNTTSAPQISIYKNMPGIDFTYHNNHISSTNNYPYQPSYHPQQSTQPNSYYHQTQSRNLYNIEEERHVQEEMENRARRFKETLDRKLDEVYKQLQTSKKSQGGDTFNVVQDIRRRLKSNSYLNQQDNFEMQKSGIKQFEEEFSQFYKIPKRTNDLNETKNRTMKNLDYNAQSRYNSGLKNYGEESRHESRHNVEENSRIYTERPQRTEYNNAPEKWGNKRNNNFLGNREALDLKIESTLTNIDQIIGSNIQQNND